MLKKLAQHKHFTPTLVAVLMLIVAAMVYYHPLLSGKTLEASDIILVQGMQKDVLDYREQNDEEALWSQSMFSGMPAQTIHIYYYGNALKPFHKFMRNVFPGPMWPMVYGLITMFIFLRLLKVNIPLSAAGAIAYAFFSYHIIITEAGHGAKYQSLLTAAGVLMAVQIAFRKNRLLGAALLTFTLGTHILANHVQMTYYLILVVALFGLYELFRHWKEARLKAFGLTMALLLPAAGVAFFLNANSLLPLREYNDFTIRGPSELEVEPQQKLNPGQVEAGKKSSGVDRDYAFRWSNGRDELFTLLIPRFKGGASGGTVDEGAPISKVSNDPNQKYPLYWGPQPFTSGPTYAGAVVCFLFILGMALARSGLKWVFFYSTVIFAILSLGKNSFSVPLTLFILALPAVYYFSKDKIKGLPNVYYGLIVAAVGLAAVMFVGSDNPEKTYKITDLLFDYLPLYSKFRAPASILGMVGLTMAVPAALGAAAIFDSKIENEEKLRGLYVAAGVVGGLLLFFWLAGGSLYSFTAGEADQRYDPQIVKLLKETREYLLAKDAGRGLLLVLIAAGALFAYARGWMKQAMLAGTIVAAVALIDLFAVDARFLWKENYVEQNEYKANFRPKEADQFLLANYPNQYFRVFPFNNRIRNTFNDGQTPYYLNTIGGYNAAKLKRYQQMIEAHISRYNPNVINMLNTRFILSTEDMNLGPGMPKLKQTREGEFIYENRSNYGPAWIVQDVKVVDKPDDAIYGLGKDDINTRFEAIVESKDGKSPSGFSTDSLLVDTTGRFSETVKLKRADNRDMEYVYYSPKKRFVVFSEIFYPKGWKAYIDGKEAEIWQTNYILRGLVVPEGRHEITFHYEPEIIEKSENMSRIASVIMLLALIGGVFFSLSGSSGKKGDGEAA